jgi:predicted DNA-binding WGR domain protein
MSVLSKFTTALEARDPALGRFRSYRIQAGTDLFGDWLVEVTYGRIGSPGRTIRHVAPDEAGAQKIVRQCLQRRGTARRRLGVGYQLRELSDQAGWLGINPAV